MHRGLEDYFRGKGHLAPIKNPKRIAVRGIAYHTVNGLSVVSR